MVINKKNATHGQVCETKVHVLHETSDFEPQTMQGHGKTKVSIVKHWSRITFEPTWN